MSTAFELENAFLEAAQAYPEIKACDANRALIQEFLTDQGLPTTSANIAVAIVSLSDQLAKVQRVREPEPVSEPVPETEQQLLRRLQKELSDSDPRVAARAKQQLKDIANKDCKGKLPKMPEMSVPGYTPSDIKNASRSTLENLYAKYGGVAVRRRERGIE
jgi:hypothetical protein